MKRAVVVGFAALASLILMSPMALAQDVETDTDSTLSAPSSSDVMTEVKASSYVQETGMGDLFGVQASELALKKSGNPQVRAFAQHVVRDHSTLSRALDDALAAAKVDAKPPASLDLEHQQLLDTLKASTGADFDRNYLKMQMDTHQDALRTQVDYRLHGGNAELQNYAAKATTVVQSHLSELGKISQGSLLP
jgi:putative membrane protein